MSNILTNNINPRSGNLITIGGANDRVSIAGTLSYEDVTNIDSVGIITAQSGIRVPGGRVGIGTDNPQRLLHVVDAVTDTLALFHSGDADSQINFQDSSSTSNGISIGCRGENFYVRTGLSTERMRIDSSGRMGLGVTPPNYGTNVNSLDIHSSGATLTYLGITNSTTGSGGATNGFNIIQNGLNTQLYLRESGFMSFSTADTEQMRIDSSGRVLIGTNSTTLPHLLNVDGSTKTGWFTCDSKFKSPVNASGTAVLTINGSNPTFVQVYIKANFAANGALQAHFDYELITCDAQGSGGTTTIRQSLNESVGSFQISTSDFAVTKSGQNIIITYTNQASGANQIFFYVKGLFNDLSLV